MSLFISFEGGEGSGKSTQAQVLFNRLRAAYVRCILVREPGTTPLGEYLREWLKREQKPEDTTSATAELLLFAAARAELVKKVLRPALADGLLVITDRYSDSTAAYQGYGRGLPLEDVHAVNRIATEGLSPDVTFLLDCPPDRAMTRIGVEGQAATSGQGGPTRLDPEGTRRFEQESLGFHTRVRQGYLALAREAPDRWNVVNATRGIEEISNEIWKTVEARLPDFRQEEGG